MMSRPWTESLGVRPSEHQPAVRRFLSRGGGAYLGSECVCRGLACMSSEELRVGTNFSVSGHRETLALGGPVPGGPHLIGGEVLVVSAATAGLVHLSCGPGGI